MKEYIIMVLIYFQNQNLIILIQQLESILQMSSALKTLMQEYAKKVQEQDNWQPTSQQNQYQAEKCERLVINLSSGSSISKLSDKIIASKGQKFLEKLCSKQKKPADYIQRILGIFITNMFQKDPKFKGLNQQLEVMYQSDDDEETGEPTGELTGESTDFTIEEDQSFTSYSSIYSKTGQSQTRQIQSLRYTFRELFNAFQQPKKDQFHAQKVNEYLSKLRAPQTQMMYLCQHFGWKGEFKDRIGANSQFEVSAIIQFEYKKQKRQLVEVANYKNKKSARVIAAFRMLRKIYLSFPQIWNIYRQIKEDKSLQVPKDDLQTTRLLQSTIKSDKVEIIKLANEKSIEFEKEMNQYLSQIQSFKSQMNILIQQIPGLFTHPKMQKMSDRLGWKVKGELVYKDIAAKSQKRYTEVDCNANSKQAEESVAKKLLTKMYSDNKDILERMVMIKARKGIKT